MSVGKAEQSQPGQRARQRLDWRNRTINRSRTRVEYVFAGLEQLGSKVVRVMTWARNELAVLLKCAACNAKGLVWLMSHDPLPGA